MIVDNTGNPKQGGHSVGVARQYCSELGKVANCQVLVTCHYADPATSWSVNAQLYLPKEWTEYPQRMQEAGDPEAKVQRADAVMHQIPKRKWQTIRWREGTKGWLRRKFTAVRAYRVVAGERKTQGWLIGERPGYGQKGEWKYYFSDFPVDTPHKKLVDYVPRVDRFYEDAKNELGWGDYQGRSRIRSRVKKLVFNKPG